jgi:Family of unknown function (DUF6152)
MKSSLLIFLGLNAALFLLPAAARGHHGWAAFVSDSQLTLKGTVKDFHFVSPHSVVEFEVKDDKGKVLVWEGEMTSPSGLAPRGWTAASLQPGDKITVTGYPAIKGTHAMRVTKIVLADGKELKLGGVN